MHLPGSPANGGTALQITSSRMGACWMHMLGFAAATGRDEVFRALVLARIIEPASKLDSLSMLEEAGMAPPSYRRSNAGYASTPTPAGPAVGQAGGVLLTEAVRLSGLDAALSATLASWRKPLAIYDSGKVVTDLALTLALGGDCLADIALLRAEPGVYGRVASDPTVSLAIDALAADACAALKAVNAARAAARARVWALAGDHALGHGADAAAPLIVDIDATLVTSHSEKEQAAPTFKRGFGHHPLCSFVDHGPEGSGSPWP